MMVKKSLLISAALREVRFLKLEVVERPVSERERRLLGIIEALSVVYLEDAAFVEVKEDSTIHEMLVRTSQLG